MNRESVVIQLRELFTRPICFLIFHERRSRSSEKHKPSHGVRVFISNQWIL
ncbi:hypothetical protein HanXRQr2_Chr03g0109811 [Helianthus annuus]|uniref:Uncharacterized protein n=1 Tax=Helianthus annuus TaxID=4232 RepID=A0A9K3NV13_HELAN|nr:hypothetical protein HanXRQr2_Chr03g0109811 [Helianthus annuus]KAJ0602621.1 hypothetical protein HanIR_Chr03g0141801 [Helianthus annuus]